MFRFLPPSFGPRPNNGNFIVNKHYAQEECDFKGMLLQEYNIPYNNDMLVVLPFFNPCNSIRMVQNLLLIKAKFEVSKTPYIIIHCLFPNSKKLMHESTTYVTVRSDSYAFLKENLANIAISTYGKNYSKFMILDADVIFESKNWYDVVSNTLDTVSVVQPYSEFKNLDINFLKICKSGQGTLYKEIVSRKICDDASCDVHENDTGHPGYCIAFTKEFLEKQKYPDINLIGGGDTLICSLVLKRKIFEQHVNSKYHHYVYNKYITDNEFSWGVISGTVFHLCHNYAENRQYSTRYFILSKYINDDEQYKTIDDIICKNKDGVYEWIDEIRDNINSDMLNYFSSRQDDEV